MFTRGNLLLFVLLTTVAVGTAADGPRVRLKYAGFDPASGEPKITSHLRSTPTPGREDYYVVQFRGPVRQLWKEQLLAVGAKVFDYVPDFAFVARMTPEAAEKARDLWCVRWVGPYHPAYRISPRLKGASGKVKVTVLLFPGENPGPARSEIRRAGGIAHSSKVGPLGGQVEATIPAAAAARIAAHRGVAWIEPRVERKLHNDVGRGLMNVPDVWTGAGLFGAGEIVAVCDTGLDTGKLSSISADFAGRVLATYGLGRRNKWDDSDGHGTHVAGSVLGSGALSGSDPATHNYATSFAGTAPEAQLVFQSVLDRLGNLGGIPLDLNDLFQPPYDDGARVHTNSWGAPVDGAYTTDSRNLDMFTWNNKDMVVLFSAGNQGIDADSDGVVDPDSIGSPGTAKNCITVGANENYRLSGGAQSTYGAYWPSDYPADPINSDKVSDDSSGIVAFSSRGPTDDGRVKPDVVAPGTNVVSCRSHAVLAGTLWGVYDSDYVYSGGTSMSTPLTAGTSALVREYYRTQRTHTPSGALVKATLINGATDLYPGQYGTGSFLEIPGARPNNVEGWGLVDASYIITPPPARTVEFVDETSGLATGGSMVYPYSVSGNSSPVRVTLVWTDYPAATYASPALVNDLDLVVELPDSSTLQGNGTTDRLNNVEGVDVTSPEPGIYTVTVSGYNVPNGPQPFALVVSADIGPLLPTAAIDGPAQSTALFGPVTVSGTASGADFQEYALEYGVGASPGSWLPVGTAQYSPVTDGVLGTWDTGALADGMYTLRLSVTSDHGTSTDQVTVEVLETSVSAVKNNPDGTSVTMTGKVVSAGPAEFDGVLYVQEPDRTSGLRVSLGAVQTDAVIGDLVTVTGTLQTVDGERVIVNPVVVVTGTAPGP